MMIDELKLQLNKHLEGSYTAKSPSEIRQVLQAKKYTALEKVLRNFRRKIRWLAIYVAIFTLGSFFIPSFSLQIAGFLSALNGIILITLITGYQTKIKKLFNTIPIINIREGLQVSIHTVKTFMKFYKNYISMGYVLGLLIGMILGYYFSMKNIQDPYLELVRSGNPNWTLVVVTVFAIICYWAGRKYTEWYLQKRFGAYLKMLQTCLSELEGLDE